MRRRDTLQDEVSEADRADGEIPVPAQHTARKRGAMKHLIDRRVWFLSWSVVILVVVIGPSPRAWYCPENLCPTWEPHPECDAFTNCHWESPSEECMLFYADNCDPYFGGWCAFCECRRVCDEGVCYRHISEGCYLGAK
jgi:hypothetical protein